MIRNVLIVDDDRDLLLMAEEGLKKYARKFSVLVAEGGEKAVAILQRHPVSLVVTDLKMPGMDGFSLLVHIMEHCPDVPVIVITGYGTPALENKVGATGAIAYIQKPFVLEDLARKIIETLQRESEGGVLHDFSIGVFVQLIEVEQKTCTIHAFDRRSRQKGVLFFSNGELMDARVNGTKGLEAAYTLLSWEEASLTIQNSCAKTVKQIDGDLQGVLLEAMRQKDQRNSL